MGKNGKLQEWGTCAYCGKQAVLTVDHVIPRCLFDGVKGGVPGDTPRVRACRPCNISKSADDAFLRDVLVRDPHLSQHPIAQGIRHGALARSISAGKSQYPRAASRLRYVASPRSGLIIAEPVLPKDRLRALMIRLVQGLMVAYENCQLPDTINFDVLAMDPQMGLDDAQRWAADRSGMVHTAQAGDGSVFWCVYYHNKQSQEQPNRSMWWLRFYEHAIYLVDTDASNLSLGIF